WTPPPASCRMRAAQYQWTNESFSSVSPFKIAWLRIRRSDPAEAAIQDTKSIEVDKLELHSDLVTVHFAIEDQLILRRTLKREIRSPLPAPALRERKRIVADIDRSAVMRK